MSTEQTHTHAAVAAIQYSTGLEDAFDMRDFLRFWNEGDFDVLRREWPDAPEAIYIGADPLHPETKRLMEPESTKLVALPAPHANDLAHIHSCDSRVRIRRLVEMAVVRHLLTELVKADLFIDLDNGDEESIKRGQDVEAIMRAAFEVDECVLYLRKTKKARPYAWIKLVYGNDGWDVISDYTTNLEELLTPTNNYSEALSAWF